MTSSDPTGSSDAGGAASLGPLASLLKRAGSVVEVDIEGLSMAPAIPEGSTVRVRCGGVESVAPPEVIAFLAGGRRMTIHRVVSRNGPYLLTRGDANLLCDPPLALGDVVGRVESLGSGSEWSAVPLRERRGPVVHAITGLNTWLMTAALTVHVRAAQGLALLQLAFIAPVALARHARRPSRPSALLMFSLATTRRAPSDGRGGPPRA